MKSIFQHFNALQINEWHYYSGINGEFTTLKPFIETDDYSNFILKFFQQGGKVKIFENCGISIDELRLTNHICSVFLLGTLFYNKISIFKTYNPKNSPSDYSTFPFIWFLIALFHDNAYQMEGENKLENISTLEDLVNHFDIEHSLFDRKFSKCKQLLDCRKNYFEFRKKKYQVVDHGILGGMLLFDRLVKIRREKRKSKEDTLFWGIKLENQYKMASNAISIHNIWLQNEMTCKKYKLDTLIGFTPIKFCDFPLFYILGIVDTIEPLKTYKDDNISDLDILKSINFEFGKKYLKVSESNDSKVDFSKLIHKAKSLQGWLDVEILTETTKFKITFK